MTITRPRLRVEDQLRHDVLVGVRKAEQGIVDTQPTEKQIDVLDMIRIFVAANGYPPSMRQIMDALGIQLSTVTYRLTELKRKGYVRWERGSSRTLALTGRVVGDPCEHCHGTGRAGGDDA